MGEPFQQDHSNLTSLGETPRVMPGVEPVRRRIEAGVWRRAFLVGLILAGLGLFALAFLR